MLQEFWRYAFSASALSCTYSLHGLVPETRRQWLAVIHNTGDIIASVLLRRPNVPLFNFGVAECKGLLPLKKRG